MPTLVTTLTWFRTPPITIEVVWVGPHVPRVHLTGDAVIQPQVRNPAEPGRQSGAPGTPSAYFVHRFSSSDPSAADSRHSNPFQVVVTSESFSAWTQLQKLSS